MQYPDGFLEEIKARVRLSDVIGRKVKLRKQGRDLVGLSPFSNEKTPSFHVHDDRGFYKCFSTGKGGDVIRFVMETERLSFPEAVEKLAGMAGLPMPQASREDAVRFQKRSTLQDWAEKACAWFETQLRSSSGADARAYLERRGFGPDAWTRHRIGFAPDAWRGLSDHLTRQGAKIEELVEAGLLVQPDDSSKQPWDRFRNRVIFPILDTSGRPIAFGARTLEPDGKPKYLNSSDGPLFHKGKVLYRYKAAREALAEIKDGPLSRGLIVTEGYVDSIALAEAGIGTGVAPLGTALTEDQLELLWRAGPEPILCFDGDAAGLNAASRAIDRALPMISAGRTLYFVLLPDGMDPDDVIRAQGADAMLRLLSDARPLVDLLWRRELEAEPLDTPERKAGFEKRLNDAVETIRDPAVRRAYQRELRDRAYWHFRNAGRGPERATQGKPGRRESSIQKTFHPRATYLLVKAIDTPDLLEETREALFRARFPDPDVEAIRNAVFDLLDHAESLDRTAVAAHLRNLGRERAIELLNELPVREPLDPHSGAGREWVRALEEFAVVDSIAQEARSAIGAEGSDHEVMSARHEVQLRAVSMDKRRIGRFGEGEAETGASDSGSSRLRDALAGLDDAFDQRRSGT
ncbi:MAG: DNA primase [Hyphomonadaceae bacterium]